jgi:hypothetical protein
MNNFDLKKFLVENKLTSNSRMLKEEDEVLLNYVGSNASLKDKQVKVLSSEPDGVFVKADDGSKDFVDWSEVESLDGQKVSLDTLDQISQKAKQQRDDSKAKANKEAELKKANANKEAELADKQALQQKLSKGWKAITQEDFEELITKHSLEGAEKAKEEYVGGPYEDIYNTAYSIANDPFNHEDAGLYYNIPEIEDFVDYHDGTYILSPDTDFEEFNLFKSFYFSIERPYIWYSVGEYLKKQGYELSDEALNKYSYPNGTDDDTPLMVKGTEVLSAADIWQQYFQYTDADHGDDLSRDYPDSLID